MKLIMAVNDCKVKEIFAQRDLHRKGKGANKDKNLGVELLVIIMVQCLYAGYFVLNIYCAA